ncbi:MAG: GGDEF domain-containing protein [Desulfuromonas sp.]|nr:GGDEF domain-containing protein [Desulfuromonas sp.]
MSILANFLVFCGAWLLLLALRPLDQLRRRLPDTSCRTAWMFLSIMVALFLCGYLVYGWLFWNANNHWSCIVVPTIFFFGAVFVLVVCTLSAKTANDVRRLCHLEHENVTDALMGIYNRRYMDKCLREEAEKAKRYGLELSVLLIDVDHFKDINDTYGHAIGDQVLHSLGQLIQGSVRDFDRVFRYGGEEIVVLLPYTNLNGARILGERLCGWVAERSLCQIDRGQVQVTISVGVSTFNADKEDMGILMSRADAAMYRAKENGRNRVECANAIEETDG